MPTTGRTSDYDNELTSQPADDDLFDVSVLISTGPDVWQSQKMRYAEINFGVAISNDVIAIGNAAGDGIEDSTGKAGGVVGYLDDFVIAHKDFHNDTEYMAWQDEFGATYYSTAAGATASYYVGGDLKMTMADTGTVISAVAGQRLSVGVYSIFSGPKFQVRGEGNTNATSSASFRNIDNDVALLIDDAGFITLLNGTEINEFSTDDTLAGNSDDAVPTEKAVKTYVDAQSGGGWLGSETRIKIAPWDVVSYNDKDGVSIQNNGGVVNDAAAKITTMVTGVFIPTGYRATAFMINASANIAVELFESQIDDDTQVSKGSGNANTEVNITNVDSTTTNYLTIIIVETGNDIYGGYITIQKI